jgi:hypothetical protein
MWKRRRKVVESYTLRHGVQPGGAREWREAQGRWTVIQQSRDSRTPFALYNNMMQKVTDLFEVRVSRGARNKLIGELGGERRRLLVEITDADKGRGEVQLAIRPFGDGEFLHDYLPGSFATMVASAVLGDACIPF